MDFAAFASEEFHLTTWINSAFAEHKSEEETVQEFVQSTMAGLHIRLQVALAFTPVCLRSFHLTAYFAIALLFYFVCTGRRI